jgi:ADP-ribose pyrophosphatase
MIEPWTLLDERPGSTGYLEVMIQTFRLPDGTEASWDIYGCRQAVAALAITPEDNVVLTRQYRPGPGLVLDELPGGKVEEGEDPLSAGERELLEETGYAGRAEMAGRTWHGSGSRMERFVILVRDAQLVAPPAPDPGEFIDVVLLPLSDLRAHVRTGQLTCTDLGYLALDYLGML